MTLQVSADTEGMVERRVVKPLAGRPLDAPHPSRMASAHPLYERILAAHRSALAEGAAMYEDPATGLYVMTAATLADRGWCCDQGCRHCPYLEG
jgi:hypothetical protein